MNRLELVIDENEREKDSPFLGEPPTLPQLVMNILSLEEKLISNNWLIVVVGKLFLILLQIITSSADEPSTSKIQNSKAGWTIAANNSQHHSKSNNSYEQKWGQSRIYTFEGQNLNSQSNSSVPRLMAWQEWQKMQQMRNYDREESMRDSTRGPFLLILADGQKAEKRSNKTSGYLPAEAEEEVAEEESPTRGNKEKEWQGTAYSATDVISRIDKDPNLATRSIHSQVLKTTTLSTVDQLNNQNPAGPGLLFGKPAGIIQPEQPAAPMDFRQLPSLMLLLKQIPTVIRSFNENQLSTAEHKGAAQSWNGGLLPFSAAGNGLLQGLLGTTLEDQPPTTAVQQSKIPVQNGGYSEDKNHAAKIPTAFWEGGENPKVTGVSSLIKSLSAEQQMHQQHQMSLAPAIRPIVPVVTTHGNEMAGQIEIRRLQNKQSSNKYEKEKTAIGSGNAGKMIKLGSKERQQRLKIYGAMPAPPSTLIPATTNSDNGVKMRRPRPQFDMGKLTVGELGQLERIHRKLFNDSSGERKLETDDEDEKEETENIGEAAFESRKGVSANHQAPKPLNFASHAEDEANLKAQEARTNGPDFVPASSPRSSASNMAYLKELVSKGVELGQLDQGILNDLLTVGELPDLEQLTSGMDLGLLQKPGGFSILKQQFVQRLIQRAYGNGFSSNNSFKFS